jgi:hypothetical protein
MGKGARDVIEKLRALSKNMTMLFVTIHTMLQKQSAITRIRDVTLNSLLPPRNEKTTAQLFGQNKICTLSSTFLTLFPRLVSKVLSTPPLSNVWRLF